MIKNHLLKSVNELLNQCRNQCKIVLVRIPQGFYLFVYDRESGIGQLFFQNLDAFAAPSIAAKGRCLFLFEFERLQKYQPTSHAGQNVISNRRRTHRDSFGLEHLGHNFVLVCLGDVEQLDNGIRTLFCDLTGNFVSDLCGTLPHGIIGDGHLIFLIAVCPFCILLHDLQLVVPPDRTVAGGDDINGKVQPYDLLDFFATSGEKGVRILA